MKDRETGVGRRDEERERAKGERNERELDGKSFPDWRKNRNDDGEVTK